MGTVLSVIPLQGLSLPGLCADQPEAEGKQILLSKLCFLLTDEYLLIFSAVCLAKLCSNILIII